jgi:hypothetical protein
VRPRAIVRFAARAGFALVVAVVAVTVVTQYARIIGRNVGYAAELRQVRVDIAELERKRDQQQREIARLSDPRGAIPEIHDRLHLVGDHEAIVYLKKLPPR